MKKVFKIFILAVLLPSCSVCKFTGGYQAANDSAKVCLECEKVGKTLQDAIQNGQKKYYFIAK